MMGRERSWAKALLLAGTSLVQLADACVQVTLKSVKNHNGVITDFQSPEDEIYFWMGVGRWFVFTLK